MSLLRIKELEAQLARRDERIAELERDREAARIEGWQAAREQAALMLINSYDENREFADDVAKHILDMQPPAEWNVSS